MITLDSLRSFVTGLGTAKDKGASASYVFQQITPDELNAMHRSDWLSRKVIDIIPDDMTREWRNWKAKKPQIEKIEAVEKSPLIALAAKVNEAMIAARLHGGALIYIGIKGATELSEPLDPKSVGKGDLAYLHVLSRYEVTPGEVIRDVQSPYKGQPSYWEIAGENGEPLKIHPSRMVRFNGAKIVDRRAVGGDTWDDSVLQVVYDAVRNAGSVQGHVAALIPEAKTNVIYIPGLGDQTKTEAGRQKLTARFTYANTMKSMLNALLLDGDSKGGGEKWEQKQISFAQLPEMLQQYLSIAAAAADIPATRMLSQSPKGLNATGDSDTRNHYDNCSARQGKELTPALATLDEVLIRSALGSRPAAIHYEWAPLYTLTEKEAAEVFKMKADGARALAGSKAGPLLPVNALSDALVNTFTEDGSLPGLDEAIEEHGKLSEQPDEDDDDDDGEGKEEGEQGDVAKPKAATDAAPRSLYVSRKLLNGAEFLRWAKKQGFKATLAADDLHVTITYSREPVDWMKMGDNWSGDREGNLTVEPGGARLVESLGDGGAIVLLFNSSTLAWRHESMILNGASWDHPEYQPHVTITYDGQGVDLTEVEPYRGKLVFGPEIFEELREDWAKGVSEA